MLRRWVSRARPLAAVLALFLGLSFSAPPAWAGEGTPSPPMLPRRPLSEAVAAKVASLDASAAVATTQAPPAAPASESKPFFRSTKGVVSIILMAGATAWLVQSRINNKVSSPGRK